MDHISNPWGVEINGTDRDKEVWKTELRSPFDPFIEEVKDARGDYLVLRSKKFNGVSGSEEVHKLAKGLFSTLNVIVSKHASTNPIVNGAVVEFLPNSQPKRTNHLEAKGITVSDLIGTPTATALDAKGNVIATPRTPSKIQRWISAAIMDPEIGSALRYFEGNPDWVELYKAYEAIKEMPKGSILDDEVTRFRRSANKGGRHHPNNKIQSHKNPMDLLTARAFITEWISAAIDDTLAKNSDADI